MSHGPWSALEASGAARDSIWHSEKASQGRCPDVCLQMSKTEPANFLKVKPNCAVGPDPARHLRFALFRDFGDQFVAKARARQRAGNNTHDAEPKRAFGNKSRHARPRQQRPDRRSQPPPA